MNFVESRKDRFFNHYRRFEGRYAAGFFVGGFIFDILTLSEPDDLLSIIQQSIYLLVIGALLIYEERSSQNETTHWPQWMAKPLQYHEAIVQFLFGSLISVYSLYYFQSSSLYKSALFLLIIFAVLVLNEIPRFQNLGLRMRYSLWSLCVISFFLTVVPVALGTINWISVCLAFLLALFVCYVWGRWDQIFKRDLSHHLQLVQKDEKLRWSAATLLIFIVLYFTKILPPVPLSLKHLGVYHAVTKQSDGTYRLESYKPWYEFWSRGDQSFEARPGDKIYIAMAVYSPARLDERINVHWLYKSTHGWQSAQKVPIAISGGRKEGFRGTAYKANYTPGEWVAQIETSDGRELGRIYINVIQSSEPLSPRGEPRVDYL